MENPDFLGENVKMLMDSRGWSLKKLAAEAGVSYHTVFRCVSKDVVPRGDSLRKLAKTFGLNVVDLWREPEELKSILKAKVATPELEARLAALEKLAYPETSDEIQALRRENQRLRRDLEEAKKLAIPDEQLERWEKYIADSAVSNEEWEWLRDIRRANQSQLEAARAELRGTKGNLRGRTRRSLGSKS